MKHLYAAIALTLLNVEAWAAETDAAPATQSDPVVVTATRTPQPLSETIQPVRVITHEEILESGQDTLAEVLQTRGGVEIASNGGPGQTSTRVHPWSQQQSDPGLARWRADQQCRGRDRLVREHSSQPDRAHRDRAGTDEQPLRFRCAGRRDSDLHLPLARCADSKRDRRGGTYNTSNVYAGVSAAAGNTSFNVNAGYYQTDGFSATNPKAPFGAFNPDNDGYRNVNGSASVVHRFSPGQEIGASAFYTEGNTHYDNGAGTDDVNHEIVDVYALYTRNRLTSWWESLLRVSQSDDELQFTGGAFPDSSITSAQTQVTWQNTFPTKAGTFVGGLEYLRQRVSGTTEFTVDSREIYSGFVSYTGDFGKHALQASLRDDDNSQFGNQTTGALGYAYRVTSELRARASAGTAFHAPSFFDLYDPFFGNPDLMPERSKSWEAGLDYTVGEQRFSITYFENNISDLIVFDASINKTANLNEANINGVELAYQGRVLGFNIGLRVTLQNPENADTGKQLPRRAEDFGSLTVARIFGRWKFGGEVLANGPRFDSVDENPATRLPGYGIVNLIATYAIAKDWKVDVRWNNIFDKDYALAYGYNTPGTNVFVALTYAMK